LTGVMARLWRASQGGRLARRASISSGEVPGGLAAMPSMMGTSPSERKEGCHRKVLLRRASGTWPGSSPSHAGCGELLKAARSRGMVRLVGVQSSLGTKARRVSIPILHGGGAGEGAAQTLALPWCPGSGAWAALCFGSQRSQAVLSLVQVQGGYCHGTTSQGGAGERAVAQARWVLEEVFGEREAHLVHAGAARGEGEAAAG
jgi:hypothetical protein